MLENDEAFALALSESGIDVSIPKRDQPITSEELSSLDELYAERPMGLAGLMICAKSVARSKLGLWCRLKIQP